MSDIATKLTYLNTTKQKIKDSINNIGGNITSETPFRQYVAALESIYQSMPKVSGSGTSLSLSPTLKGLMQSTLKGNTSQVQLSGKNLFNDYNTTSSTICGIAYSFTNNEILINGTYDKTGNWNCWLTASNNGNASNNMALLKANTTYTISIYVISGTTTNSNNQLYISSRDSNKTNFTWNYKLATFDSSTQRYKVSFTTTDSVYISGIRYSISPNNTAVFNNFKLKIQIEQNNSSTDYEQYCGGTPSPNPSYPQDIHNVSGNNSIVVCGKNLFDKDNANYLNAFINGSGVIKTDPNASVLYIPCLPSTSYAIQKSLQTTTASNRFKVGCCASIPTTETQLSKYNNLPNGTTDTTMIFETDSTAKYLVFNFAGGNQSEYPSVINAIQIEYGNQATTYEAYNGTTYPINLGSIELCKIGTYQDYIYKDSDKWYLHKEIGKYTFTGEENFTWDSDKKRIIIPISNLGINTPPLTTSQPFNVYNQKAIGTTFDNLYNKVVDNCIALSTGNSISIRSTSFDNLNTGKNTIANTDLYYILQTPTNTEITDTTLKGQLEDIYNANSYVGTTNISQTNNDLPFIIDASCLKGA